MKYLLLFVIICCTNINLLSDGYNKSDFGFNENWKIMLDNGLGPEFKEMIESSSARIKFFDKQNGFCVHHANLIKSGGANADTAFDALYRTSDGGETWSQRFTYFPYKTYLHDIMPLTNNECLMMIGNNNQKNPKSKAMMAKFKIIGLSYLYMDVDTLEFRDVAVYNSNIVRIYSDTLFCSFSSYMLKSKTNGSKWESYRPIKENDIIHYLFIGKGRKDNSLFIAYRSSDNKNYLMRSADYGQTWDKNEYPKDYITAQFESYDEWYFTYNIQNVDNPSNGVIKITENGTKFDTLIHSNTLVKEFYGTLHRYNNGVMIWNLTNMNMYLTKDNGSTWTRLTDKTTLIREVEPYSVEFVEPNKIFATGWHTHLVLKYEIPVADVESDITEFSTKLYPNPLRSGKTLYVSLNNEKLRNATVKIYDETGSQISESQEMTIPVGSHTIDYTPSYLTPGTYFIVISSNGEVLGREKFVVVE